MTDDSVRTLNVVVDATELAEILRTYCTYLRWAEIDAANRYGEGSRVGARRDKQLAIVHRFFQGGRLVHGTVEGFIAALDEYEQGIEPQTTEATTAEQLRWFLDGRSTLEEMRRAVKKRARA